VSSEDNIVAIFDDTTDMLLNIFGLLDKLLKALESSASPAVSEKGSIMSYKTCF
jgi:hypothetical protein